MLPPAAPGSQPPDPKMIAEQTKMAIAQMTNQEKAQTEAMRAQQQTADRASKERVAQIDAQTEVVKTRAQLAGDAARQHDSAAEAQIDAGRERAHDLAMQDREQIHDAMQRHLDRVTPPAPPQRLF